MTTGKKLALGCGGAGCLGILVLLVLVFGTGSWEEAEKRGREERLERERQEQAAAPREENTTQLPALNPLPISKQKILDLYSVGAFLSQEPGRDTKIVDGSEVDLHREIRTTRYHKLLIDESDDEKVYRVTLLWSVDTLRSRADYATDCSLRSWVMIGGLTGVDATKNRRVGAFLDQGYGVGTSSLDIGEITLTRTVSPSPDGDRALLLSFATPSQSTR